MFLVQKKSRERREEGEEEEGGEEGAMCQSLSSGDTWPFLSLSLSPLATTLRRRATLHGGGLACCCVGGHKLRGRDVIEKHNWRKKKEREGGRAALRHFLLPLSGLARLLPQVLSPFLPYFSPLLSLKYVPHKGAFHFSVKCGNL